MAATVILIRDTAAIITHFPRIDQAASIIAAPHSGSASIVADEHIADTVADTEVVTVDMVITEDIAVMVTIAIAKIGFDPDFKTV